MCMVQGNAAGDREGTKFCAHTGLGYSGLGWIVVAERWAGSCDWWVWRNCGEGVGAKF